MRQSVIRMSRSEIKNAEIAQGKPLDEEGVLAVLSKEAKKRRESIAEFERANRPDLVAKEKAELAILLEYLPPQLSREEIAEMAKRVIDEVGAKGAEGKGKVMASLMPQLKGKADGKLVSEVVIELLST